MKHLPLQGITVLEFCQYLSGPSAGLRLADLGARVIKIERPGTGEAGRKLAIKDMWMGDDSLLFHTINRNKESFTADLKDTDDIATLKKLIAKSDVIIHNFRPNVMNKLGLGYAALREINSGLVYAAISGYGTSGPWKNKPGQDLLLQSITGLAYTTGNGTNGPVPFGISVADILSGAQLVQGILAALIRRQKTGVGALIEVSLFESMLDFQFELLTTYFASKRQPVRSNVSNGQPLLSAPYGIYPTAEGFIAIAMMDIHELGETIGCMELLQFAKEDTFSRRDEIKEVLTRHLSQQTADHWLGLLQDAGLWSMKVLNWNEMMHEKAYQQLSMEQVVHVADRSFTTTRCPIRYDGRIIRHDKPAPAVGVDTEKIKAFIHLGE